MIKKDSKQFIHKIILNCSLLLFVIQNMYRLVNLAQLIKRTKEFNKVFHLIISSTFLQQNF